MESLEGNKAPLSSPQNILSLQPNHCAAFFRNERGPRTSLKQTDRTVFKFLSHTVIGFRLFLISYNDLRTSTFAPFQKQQLSIVVFLSCGIERKDVRKRNQS
jgi:hypothetical protein